MGEGAHRQTFNKKKKNPSAEKIKLFCVFFFLITEETHHSTAPPNTPHSQRQSWHVRRERKLARAGHPFMARDHHCVEAGWKEGGEGGGRE